MRASDWRVIGAMRQKRVNPTLIAVLLALLALLAGCGSDSQEGGGPTPTAHSVTAKVVRVVDGDTIEVSIDGDDEDVRYIGIDTPETVKPDTPVQCYGPQASAEDHRLVEGRTVRLVFDRERRDVYGRLLAYVYVGQRFVNAALVRDGYARTLTIPPNTAHAGLFRRLAAQAGRTGRGLWGAC
jgi:micrococcal nuclease